MMITTSAPHDDSPNPIDEGEIKRNRKRRWVRPALGTVALLIAALASVVAYLYWTHPARLTSSPEFSGLARTVSDNTLLSVDDPSIRMTFDGRFKHIGGQKFVLYGTADTEQHFFVEEHPDGTVKSMFWIQFEAFLPDNDYTYDYTAAPLRRQIDDFEFFTDTAPGKSAPFRLEWPGTDGALARRFWADQGYSWPDDYAYARLVHIPDAARRQELLIIFVEDLGPSGLTGPSLRHGGENEERWAEVEAAHLDRIEQVLTLSESS
ncbi:MAG: hypothetical protein ACR2QK_02245 [Acidimicrobiales bacterium]